MNSEQREALDRYLTTPPHDCEDDGHQWKCLGHDSDGYGYYKCKVCGLEDEE